MLGRLAQIVPGGYSLRPLLHRWRGVDVGTGVWISQQVYLDELYPDAISIGKDSTLGMRTSVFAHFHWGARHGAGGFKRVVIGDNVFVGPHCVILPGVRIGEGAVIKAGSVLSRNVPPWVFFGGAECRPLARVTVPLTPAYSYQEFIQGLKPLKQRNSERTPPDGVEPSD